MSQSPTSTLVLLVTCSRDASRRDLACAVARNLAELVPAAGLQSSFIAFDNASTMPDHIGLLPHGARRVMCPENIGYWSAIQWVLDHQRDLFGREFDFLYIVESDLLHRDLRPLGACEDFLRAEMRASGVRTQEFSVRWRWRFDKAWHFLPFHVTRSEVSLRNVVTGERAWFRLADARARIHLTNLHTKLPALNRVGALRQAFAKLRERGAFTENDFCAEMMALHPCAGQLDGGLYHSLSARDSQAVVSGSYTAAPDMERLGYQPTRTARILPCPSDSLRIDGAGAS